MALRNAGLSSTDSARALISRLKPRGSLTQAGISPQRTSKAAPALVEAHHRDRLRRRDIIPGREIWLLGVAEGLAHEARRGLDDVSSTHRNPSVSRCLMRP